MAFPEFRAALLAWRRAATRFLQNETNRQVTWSPTSRWVRGEDGNYRPTQTLIWEPGTLTAVARIAEAQNVEHIVKTTPAIAKHFGSLVGTPYFTKTFELTDILGPFLPSPRLGDDGTSIAPVNEHPFAPLYRSLEDFLTQDVVSAVTIWPLGGLTLEQLSLSLEPGVAIRRLSEAEVTACIGAGLIRNAPLSYSVVLASDSGFYGLVLTMPIAKVYGDVEESGGEGAALQQLKGELIEDLQAAAAVMDVSRLGISGSAEKFSWSGQVSMFAFGRTPSELWLGEGRMLSRNEAAELKRTWRSLRRVGRAANPALHLAATRLSYLPERLRPEDRILDLMIAAEALYLTDAGGQDQGELKFRLALRAALWADRAAVGRDRREIFALMKKAYDVRSVIAHGGTPSNRLMQLDGEPLELPGLIDQASAIVRDGVRKAIRSASRATDGRFRVDWESLLLR